MRRKTTKAVPASGKTNPLLLKDIVATGNLGLTIPVRAAKAKFSALLELVASGQEVTITSDAKAKAVLSPAGSRHGRKVFTGMGKYLSRQTIHGGPSAEELIREDRDSRGW